MLPEQEKENKIRTSCSSSDHEVVCGSPKRLVLVHSDFRFNTRSVANFSLFPLQILAESEPQRLSTLLGRLTSLRALSVDDGVQSAADIRYARWLYESVHIKELMLVLLHHQTKFQFM